MVRQIRSKKYMSDEEILRKYVNLDNICLNKKEKVRGYEHVIPIQRCI